MDSRELIIKYLEDVEAAERNFEDALKTFGNSGEQEEVQRFFQIAANRARTQHERLEARLRALGGAPSTAKSLLAHVLAFAPTVAQLGHEASEKNTQHLMICVAAASAEMAMYESLAIVAGAAGDTETERLARELQAEERDDYQKSWNLLRPSALASFQTVVQRHATA
ncbi:MAG: ferritin-like domain-containing protein [Acidobacteriota bacterium]|nr:ferritin-like domain-containing protein [Acidobacteriota bacterium]